MHHAFRAHLVTRHPRQRQPFRRLRCLEVIVQFANKVSVATCSPGGRAAQTRHRRLPGSDCWAEYGEASGRRGTLGCRQFCRRKHARITETVGRPSAAQRPVPLSRYRAGRRAACSPRSGRCRSARGRETTGEACGGRSPRQRWRGSAVDGSKSVRNCQGGLSREGR